MRIKLRSCSLTSRSRSIKSRSRSSSERSRSACSLEVSSRTLGTFKVYLNEELPERWFFNNKYRVGPISVVAEVKYGFQDMYEAAKFYEKAYNIPVNENNKYGVHGYDNAVELMHPVFFAYGHLIKEQNEVEPFDSVDLMYLFCEILGISPPNYIQGRRENILPVLKATEMSKMSRWIVLSEY